MHDKAAVETAVRGLFDGRIGFGLTDPGAPQPALMPEEAGHVAHAIHARQTEFAAGRAAARIAMRDVGFAPQAVPAQYNRAPQWPAGLAGSISHTKELCMAVVSTDAKSLGLDVEKIHVIDKDIISTICSEREMDHIPYADQPHLALAIFAAKEATYKAQFPLTQTLFGFDTLHVIMEPEARRFTATFVHAVGPFRVGYTLPGRFAEVAGHLVTAVTIGHFDHEGA